MQSAIEKLQKFIRLEIERGFDNRAVVGGLDKILPAWEQEARTEALDEQLVQIVRNGLKAYPALDGAGREALLANLRKQMESPGSGATPASVLDNSPSSDEAQTQPEPVPDGYHNEALLAGNRPESAGNFTPRQAVENFTVSAEDRSPQTQRSVPRPAPERREQDRYPAVAAGLDGLEAPLSVLQGVGPKMAQTLSGLGLNTLGDMLYYFPRRYDDYSQLKPINRLVFGEETTVLGTIQSIHARPIRGGKLQMVEAVITDGTAALRVNWFNQPWMINRFTAGTQVVLAGRVDQYLGRLTMTNPEIEPVEQEHLHTHRIVPVYPLTANLNQKTLRRMLYQTVTYWAPRIPDYLPARIRAAVKLANLSTALINIHFPESQDMLDVARWRLAFDEIFMLQLGVLRQKRNWQAAEAEIFVAPDDWVEQQIAGLPFPLTGAQHRVLGEIRADLASGRPMERLIQGDVGSGKTVVAALAAGIVTRAGAQAAIMAPTSILAEQHYRTLKRLMTATAQTAPQAVQPPASGARSYPLPMGEDATTGQAGGVEEHAGVAADQADAIVENASASADQADAILENASAAVDQADAIVENASAATDQADRISPSSGMLQPGEIRLLVGDTPEAEKEEIRTGLEQGAIKVVIGTHALIEGPVRFQRLRLAVIDEQHRFGVAQRAALRAKGNNPHLLVMTATPIPRSLALTVYGDLDLSVMDEMPPGRQPVETHVLRPVERERVYQLIRSQVEKGRQAFIIYPKIQGEEVEGEPAPEATAAQSRTALKYPTPTLSAVEEHQRLQKVAFPRLRLGLLHGRLKPEEKDKVMRRFRDHEFDILVSTTVVEVGVDVPNATVMMIEGANRFGLAQLHQLRGRVGRGAERSFCLLIPATDDDMENERLAVMAQTNDGFVLAEQDLQQRGPGEFLGTRQAGFSTLKLASLTDVRLIEKARQQAQTLFQADPDFTAEEHQLLRAKLALFWNEGRGDIS